VAVRFPTGNVRRFEVVDVDEGFTQKLKGFAKMASCRNRRGGKARGSAFREFPLCFCCRFWDGQFVVTIRSRRA